MTTLIVFGASGDLMRRKIVPALQTLRQKGRLPEVFQLVGFGRRPWSDADFEREVTGGFPAHYVHGQFLEAVDYEQLLPYLTEQTLFYLVVQPMFYESILKRLAAMIVPEGIQTRLLLEKPFGNDGETAEALDKRLSEMFSESQIYRVDHYLAKDIVPLAATESADTLTRIEIRLNEMQDVEHRGAFYDATGSLRDWHSHHLQLLALLLQNVGSKQEILNALQPPTSHWRGQYRGFRDHEGVDARSDTETAFRLETSLNFPGWKGVSILLEGGKKMKEDQKEIVIVRRNGTREVRPLQVGIGGMAEYETILLDAMHGDQRRFVSNAEVRAMWRFVDPILRAWHQGMVPLDTY
jgi:glucose-6-phosphate 1-dehydrogenase